MLKFTRQYGRFFQYLILGLMLILGDTSRASAASIESPAGTTVTHFPRPVSSYADDDMPGIGSKLIHRIKSEPFNIVASLIFLCAIIHTFLASRFMAVAHRYQHQFEALALDYDKSSASASATLDRLEFRAHVFHFFGEVEAVFGIWLIPLAIAIVLAHGWSAMVHYISGVSFAEPVFVVVIMAIASTRPILHLAERCLAKFASLGGSSPSAWWFSILTVGPLLGSLITEPAAITICALLLLRRFYALKPGLTLRYATLGLLFVNISVGGTLTHFAAPPVVMVAHTWNWGFAFMLEHFGWKAVIGILVANTLCFLKFRGEMAALVPLKESGGAAERAIPIQVTLTHLAFIAWTVLVAHYPALVVLGFLFFLAYVQATGRHQQEISLRSPMLVGFFLASLVVHGGCQQWWIAPVLGSLPKWPLMLGSMALTSVNDNAAITFLASLVPNLSDALKYAVVVGAVAGGGLTVIANAPNPAGQSILQSAFGDEGISPLKLFLAALLPTAIMAAAFMLLP
ncbi:MAG: putative Na+/H+ antiporter [Chthoniobacteraceae bacterium]